MSSSSLLTCAVGLSLDLELITYSCSCVPNRTYWQFKDSGRIRSYWRNAPRSYTFFQVNDFLLLVEVYNVNRKPHGKRMHAMARDDPEALALGELRGIRSQQPFEPAPMRIGEEQVRRDE